MTTPAHKATSRSREAPQGDEEASSELRLGEFQNVDALTHSEAALVINALVAKRRVDRKNVNETECVLFFPRFYTLHFTTLQLQFHPPTLHKRTFLHDEDE